MQALGAQRSRSRCLRNVSRCRFRLGFRFRFRLGFRTGFRRGVWLGNRGGHGGRLSVGGLDWMEDVIVCEGVCSVMYDLIAGTNSGASRATDGLMGGRL